MKNKQLGEISSTLRVNALEVEELSRGEEEVVRKWRGGVRGLRVGRGWDNSQFNNFS